LSGALLVGVFVRLAGMSRMCVLVVAMLSRVLVFVAVLV